MIKAKIKFLKIINGCSRYSPLPSDWAISPVVPILKKPKLQKINVITVAEILVAIKKVGLSRWPISAVSTIPTNGKAIFEKKWVLITLKYQILKFLLDN